MKRADYQGSRQQFLSDSPDAIIGSLTANSFFAVDLKQRNAWLATIAGLKTAVCNLSDAYIFLEFTIPRMGRRVDAVVLRGGCVFVLEYKVGAKHFFQTDIDQVVGYALDLKNFHEASHPLQFMREKRKIDLDESEPELLLSMMDRLDNWCTIICLVGNGQEINTGEAGLNEWITVLIQRFPKWQVHLSDRILTEPEAFGISQLPEVLVTDSKLHLATTIRPFRSESVSSFASAIIDGKPKEAHALSQKLGRFEFKITRDLGKARDWLRQHRRGTERAGLLAFSNALRSPRASLLELTSTQKAGFLLIGRTFDLLIISRMLPPNSMCKAWNWIGPASA